VTDVCAKVAEYSEPEARAAIAWIFGEHAESIPDCHKIFDEYFLQTFLEDPT